MRRLIVGGAVASVVLSVLLTVLTYPKTGVPQAVSAIRDDLQKMLHQTAVGNDAGGTVSSRPTGIVKVTSALSTDVRLVTVAQKASEVRITTGDTWALEKEQAIFRGINEIRTKQKVPALSWNETAAKVARASAREMVETQWIDAGYMLKRSGTDPATLLARTVRLKSVGQSLYYVGLEPGAAEEVSEEDVTTARGLIVDAPQDWYDAGKVDRLKEIHTGFDAVGVGIAWVDRPLYIHLQDKSNDGAANVVAIVVVLYCKL